LLYTAKGLASLLVALCVTMRAQTGNWNLVFGVMITADAIAAILALLVLRPLRARIAEKERRVANVDEPSPISSSSGSSGIQRRE
jgi:MFS transporter, OFA family, oxalate/formate antiporter